MNYTENYHLPQWEETDRIMRTDFNDAMASIEGGLAAADVAGAVADSMSRDVYRQIVQSRVCHGPGNQPRSMWINALASREDAGGEGHGWNGRYGVCHGTGGMPTMEGIRATAKEGQQINTVASGVNHKEMAFTTFTSDGYGLLESIMLWFSWHSAYGDGGNLVYSVTVSRADTGEILDQSGTITRPASDVSSNPRQWYTPASPIPLEAQVPYRLEMNIGEGNNYWGTAGFSLATTSYTVPQEITMTFLERSAETTITKTVTAPEWATGAMGILRWKGDGSVTPAIDGQTVLLTSTQEELNALGETCKVSEFLLPELPQEPFELTMLFNKGEEDLELYDYGLIWR